MLIYFSVVGYAVPWRTPRGLLTSCSTSPSHWRRTGRKSELKSLLMHSELSESRQLSNVVTENRKWDFILYKICTSTFTNCPCLKGLLMAKKCRVNYFEERLTTKWGFCWVYSVITWRPQVTHPRRVWLVCDLLLALIDDKWLFYRLAKNDNISLL